MFYGWLLSLTVKLRGCVYYHWPSSVINLSIGLSIVYSLQQDVCSRQAVGQVASFAGPGPASMIMRLDRYIIDTWMYIQIWIDR